MFDIPKPYYLHNQHIPLKSFLRKQRSECVLLKKHPLLNDNKINLNLRHSPRILEIQYDYKESPKEINMLKSSSRKTTIREAIVRRIKSNKNLFVVNQDELKNKFSLKSPNPRYI